jgi:hypothetical protein
LGVLDRVGGGGRPGVEQNVAFDGFYDVHFVCASPNIIYITTSLLKKASSLLKDKIRNSKSEIPGPDRLHLTLILRYINLKNSEQQSEPILSRQGGPKQYPMTKIQNVQLACIENKMAGSGNLLSVSKICSFDI